MAVFTKPLDLLYKQYNGKRIADINLNNLKGKHDTNNKVQRNRVRSFIITSIIRVAPSYKIGTV